VRAFISSEMETAADEKRRRVAVDTISGLGHEPVYFEGKAARPLPRGMDALAFCRKLVRESDVLLAIVDDAVTEAMEAELDEAHAKLGEERVFYYFVRGQSRDSRARSLWNGVKHSNLIATFTTDPELATAVRKSMASYIDDALRARATARPNVVLDSAQVVTVGQLRWWHHEFEAGDRITVDIYGNGRFYAALLTAAQFAKLHSGDAEYGMSFGSDKTAFHLELEVEDDGDYYLAIKRGMWNDRPVAVNIRWVRR
jgi:hypothetical protein